MKEIKLTQNQVAIVDDWRYEEINQYRWYANWSKNTQSFYAARNIKIGNKRSIVQMQTTIANTPKHMYTDHINRNSLDNREENLRICTNSQNLINRGKQKNNTSGYKGVYKARNGRWFARVKLYGKIIHLGTYDTLKEAALAYNIGAKKYFGEFAKLNEVI